MDVYDVGPDYTFTRYYRTDTDPITVKINARDRLLPDIYATQKYLPLNSNGKISWIAETGNSCNACHSVGYFYDARDEENQLGRMNDVVSGYHHSLRKRTTSNACATIWRMIALRPGEMPKMAPVKPGGAPLPLKRSKPFMPALPTRRQMGANAPIPPQATGLMKLRVRIWTWKTR